MPVIAMTREMGSLGKDVAEGFAQELGLRLLYTEIVDSLAEKMHMSPSTVTRFVQGRANTVERFGVDMDGLSLYTAEEVFELAARGNLIIRGWGATYLLRPVSHVLCIRVCAPLELRVTRMMERLGIDDPEFAAEEIRHSDAAHSATMQRRFGVDWKDPVFYDLVLNTATFSVADCIGQIKNLLPHPAFRETAESRTKLANLALATHINAALRNNNRATARVRITIDAANNAQVGHLILRGIVADEAERRAIEEVAARHPGVAAVQNQLKLMTPRRIPKLGDG